jgi:NAD(P)-dependent dehydrogenase (short-subunit alcohol dehydrogenase family)
MIERHSLIVGRPRGIVRELAKQLVEGEVNSVLVLGRSLGGDVRSPKLTHYAADVSNREALSNLDQAVERYKKPTYYPLKVPTRFPGDPE